MLFRETLYDNNSHFLKKKPPPRKQKVEEKSLSERSEAGPRALQSITPDLEQLLRFRNKMG